MKTNPSRPIICGTDFSEPAAHAGNVAAAIAIRLGTSLLLVHGVDEHGEIPGPCWPSLMETMRPRLSEEAERLRKLGAQVQETLAGGAPDDGVACCAENADARLIVLASSGQGALARWTLGSVSERIAESAWTPTLVLRNSARIEDWARGGKPLRVFIGADFTASSDGALRWAADLREIGPCEFTVAYVDRFAEERAEQAMKAPPDTPRAPELQEMLVHDLRQKAECYFPLQAVHIRVLPAPGRVDARLLELAGEACADLIVVGSHQWHGLSRLRHPSVSRRVLHAAKISVACVPARQVVSAASAGFSKTRRLLAATDLSTHGSSAIPYAFSLLRQGDAVCLLHVAKPEEGSEQPIARMRALIPSEAEEHGVHVKTEVVTGHDVAAAICDAARRFDADFICIGSHGPSKGAAAALRSTSCAVLARSTRPVLIVPQKVS